LLVLRCLEQGPQAVLQGKQVLLASLAAAARVLLLWCLLPCCQL
jgi:hypothetical protein